MLTLAARLTDESSRAPFFEEAGDSLWGVPRTRGDEPVPFQKASQLFMSLPARATARTRPDQLVESSPHARG